MSHDHGHTANRNRLLIAIGIVAVVLVVEVVGAWVSGSLSLLADAGHMLSDLAGLIIALMATIVAARPATDRQTFGFRRAEVFGALINGLILVVVAVTVTVGAIGRLVGGETEVHSIPMLVVAAIGLVANFGALLLLRPSAGHSINMRGAYLEVFGDLVGSATVIVAAVVILLTGFTPADAIASLLIAALIVPRAFVLLRDVVRVLSEAAPADTDVAEIRDHILGTPGVVAVHDVHVWAITSGAPVFSAHVVCEPAVFREGRTGTLLDELSGCLTTHFDVEHSTFQLEPAEHAAHEDEFHR
ncbi:cobalt-zinc-cadmium efflux system protein [Leifsonia sp. 98AMF]|jgi:cobalt-zinc-cadmium efflux system protein|uniref:cation diffusion facilitator family transporter n=1 Tax=unclassified Leifsonia TaxID=2663824 RepID=UPI00087AE31E|nr:MULTISPECIES: cation diffusion facilitator family transporter [unclassified Leifsonia]SDH27901.1 cobalt-zinc-cadmium efflux system protein [Leifsonia sp. 197AMF]SDJ10554.1 cobalt-zinc-cadmium efflux system protein [Leifsonia sp. 466MF]SDJ59695.1 cobalt-zinc-cadmium efflux system protein [Leifsonia sp. 157MF]SDN31870.1 cobalt-zinc-cadmium efflux system protein [Leifsonia sp. 509MF]SEM89576.1 cobalt-zinc-cadmium efflux system protein [Leifsonia sp. 467MF]